MGLNEAVSVSVWNASFVGDVEPMFDAATTWTIIIDSGVSDFTVSNAWTNTAWSAILGEIASVAGPCVSTNTQTQTITISNC